MSTFARLVAWQRSGGGAAAAPWSDARGKLPDDLLDVLRVANGDERALAVAISITGESKATLRRAALRFIREVLLARDASHYRKLGVDSDAPVAQIRKHYRELIAIFHPDRLHDDAPAGDAARASVINEAYNVLKRPHARGAYDRELAAAVPAVPPAGAPHSPTVVVGDRVEQRRPRRVARSWKLERDPGPVRVWLLGRSPKTLKRIAFGTVALVIVIAVVIADTRETPQISLASATHGTFDGAKGSIASRSRDVPLANLVASVETRAMGGTDETRPNADSGEHGVVARVQSRAVAAGEIEASVPRASDRASVPSIAPLQMGAGPERGPPNAPSAPTRPAETPAPGAVSVLPSPHLPVAVSPETLIRFGTTGSTTLPAAHAIQLIQVPVVVASAQPSRSSGWAQASDSTTVASPEKAENPGAARISSPGSRAAPSVPAVSSAPAVSSVPAAPSAMEVDAIVARFAVAFDRGDLAAIQALIDPDVAREDRISFTLANFSRVFRESASRRIELQVLQRSYEQDRARISLAATTTLGDNDAGLRRDTGELTLVFNKRSGVTLIGDVRYRLQDAPR